VEQRGFSGMDVASNDLFSLAEQKLGWLENRQRVLARNVANADTPNYQPRDEQPFESALSAFTVAPVQTNPMHMSASDAEPGVVTVSSSERAPDGNQVSIESEMTKVADTDSQQLFVTNLYSKYMAMFDTALGKG
jgi:flagellar basal-body rod protein FlgB